MEQCAYEQVQWTRYRAEGFRDYLCEWLIQQVPFVLALGQAQGAPDDSDPGTALRELPVWGRRNPDLEKAVSCVQCTAPGR